jgi:hypothetical protein
LASVVIELITESLLASPRFRRRGRDWAARREEDERIARLGAVAIIEHLRRCGIEWTNGHRYRRTAPASEDRSARQVRPMAGKTGRRGRGAGKTPAEGSKKVYAASGTCHIVARPSVQPLACRDDEQPRNDRS